MALVIVQQRLGTLCGSLLSTPKHLTHTLAIVIAIDGEPSPNHSSPGLKAVSCLKEESSDYIT